jgi:Ca2+-binding EF-hand superfamily protein
MGIGAIISIAASIFQTVRTLSQDDSSSKKADQLFSQLDVTGKGNIEPGDLQGAFDKIAVKATQKTDQLFAKLDADGDGQVTKTEFSGSINRLAEQLDEHYQRLRMQGANATFSKDELAGAATNMVSNFEKADSNSDGKLSLKEAADYGKSSSTNLADGQNVELMLQVMKLMQAYGTSAKATETAAGKSAKIAAAV